MMKLLLKNMGRRMRQLRMHLGLTQERVAETVGIETAYYGQLERGARSPSLPTLVLIAECLKTHPSLLLAEDAKSGADREVTYRNVRGILEDLPERDRKFVAGLVRDAAFNLKKSRSAGK